MLLSRKGDVLEEVRKKSLRYLLRKGIYKIKKEDSLTTNEGEKKRVHHSS